MAVAFHWGKTSLGLCGTDSERNCALSTAGGVNRPASFALCQRNVNGESQEWEKIGLIGCCDHPCRIRSILQIFHRRLELLHHILWPPANVSHCSIGPGFFFTSASTVGWLQLQKGFILGVFFNLTVPHYTPFIYSSNLEMWKQMQGRKSLRFKRIWHRINQCFQVYVGHTPSMDELGIGPFIY